MTKIGTFTIEESFNITGRGIVVLGYMDEQYPKLGQYIQFTINDTKVACKIIGIERGNVLLQEPLKWGIMIDIKDHKLLSQIQTEKIKPQIGELYEFT